MWFIISIPFLEILHNLRAAELSPDQACVPGRMEHWPPKPMFCNQSPWVFLRAAGTGSFRNIISRKNTARTPLLGGTLSPTSLIFSAAKTLERLRQRRRAGSEDGPQVLSRIYEVGNGLALTLTLSPRRGKQVWPRWDESLISERRAALESVSLSPGERAGVRASVLSTELFRP